MLKRGLYLLFIFSLLIGGCTSAVNEGEADNISRLAVEEENIEERSFDDYDDYDIKNDERRHYRRYED